MAYDESVQILFQLIDDTKRSADAIEKNLKAIQKQTEKGKSSFEQFAIAMVAINQGIGVIQKVGDAAKKAFEFAEQGAQIKQMEMSWDGLVSKLGVAPSILDDMSAASRRTISDFQLQASTTTLLAGANDDLAKAMLEASPQLVEIAKAANKLNPALGDTTFLYESIAKGIKRAQPLILDNLGITLKVEEAYDSFAKGLGKTADELTADQRAMAILNDTVKQGKQIIDQAGGSAEAVTDVYGQIKIVLDEVGQSFKELLDSALGPLLQKALENIDSSEKFSWALDTLNMSAKESFYRFGEAGDSVDEWHGKVIEAAEVQDDLNKRMEETSTAFLIAKSAAHAASMEIDSVGDEAEDTALSLEDLGKKGHQAPLDIAGGFHEMIVDMQAGGEEARTAIENIYQAVLDGEITREEADKMTAEITLAYEARKAEIEGNPFDYYATRNNIHDQLDIPLADVWTLWTSMKEDMGKGISTTVWINRITSDRTVVTGGTPGTGGTGAGAGGSGTGAGGGPRGHQLGGHVMPWETIIGGEGHPELFRPSVSGNIVPNPGSFPVGGGVADTRLSEQLEMQTQLLMQLISVVSEQGTMRDLAQATLEGYQFASG